MKLKLDTIDKDFAFINIEVKVLEHKTTKVVVKATSHAAIIISEHTITEMRMLIEVLDNYDILKFAKKMLEAKRILDTEVEI